MSLILERIEAVDRNLSERVTITERNLQQRLDTQDRTLRDIQAQTRATNGRVTALEKARERAQGVMTAFAWLPVVLSSLLTAGLTVLVTALSGGIH